MLDKPIFVQFVEIYDKTIRYRSFKEMINYLLNTVEIPRVLQRDRVSSNDCAQLLDQCANK